ncbi:L10-interacting MYB domain-containing protein [Camellia lanceoleosa]|uniref:L10-interacting MYB domain-containing protein n=1 Tax=Camellia lanceoleosa TaxID=1840588 RepID=A0ACC0GCL6_9ERIC|nr:L10-interacting MYB domain-containing protein [Camellia lanceoleosa]
MLTLFNAKFGPQHSKRVLRHRYKKLWKYYNDVTVLLKQNGFSWDESQEMVVADDDVWDAYVKSDSRQDKELEDDTSGIKAGSERSRTYWTPPMDRCLIDLLLDQVHKGNKIGQTFISQAWNDMVASFNAKFKSHYDRDVLKNRYKHLRRQYNDVKVLLEQNGFSWDETREMVTAEDHVWDTYTTEHPDAIAYKNKTLGYYNDLCILFGSGIADGGLSCQDMGTEIDYNALEIEMDQVSGCIQIPLLDVDTSDQGKKRPTKMPSVSGQSRKVQKTGEEIQEPCTDTTSVVTRLVKKQEKSYDSIANAIDALQSVSDIDDELLLDGCDLLEDERKAKTFLALDVNLRRRWLLRKLGR